MSIKFQPEWDILTNRQIAGILGCSSTAVLYARRRAAGLCERCTSPAAPGRVLCVKHEAAADRTRRKRLGHKPWKAGGRGRPPKFI